MKQTVLNRIIICIRRQDAKDRFMSDCDDAVRSHLLIWSEGMYGFADSLYISDDPDMCARFAADGYAVAALVHDANRHQEFPQIRYLLEQPELISLEDYDNIYRRTCALPLDILETPRLLIRETTLDDLDRFYELYEDPEVKRFMEPLFPRQEEEEYQKDYISRIYAFYEIGMWTVIRKEDDMIIGRMGIEYTASAGCAELGFMIAGDCRRMGYAYEGCMAIIEHARSIEGIERIRARVRSDNEASENLCRKLGFEPVCELNDGLREWSYTLNIPP